MKIVSMTARAVLVPMTPPIISKSGRFDAMSFVLVEVKTACGVSGISYLWTFSSHGSAAVLAALREVETVAIGADPRSTDVLWDKMWRKIAQWGHGGIAVLAVAGIDIACWDIKAKSQGVSVARLLGAEKERVDAYYSGGLWLIDDLASLTNEAKSASKQGFRAVKMRVGRSSCAEDFRAIQAVRDGLDPDAKIMVDANSGWEAKTANDWLERLDGEGLGWVEDPLQQDDIEGHAKLAARFETPITFGEKAFGPHEIARVIAASAADVIMPDIQRIGGVTPWLAVQRMADDARFAVSSHLFPEFNVHLMAAAPTGLYLEYMDWAALLFNERLQVSGGQIGVPNGVGFGLTWNESFIEKISDRNAVY